MAITWRQHIKNTMASMEKGTHLKEVLKEASKTWKSVKKDGSSVVSDVVGKTKRAHHRRSGRKGTKARKHTRRHKKSHRRGRRGGSNSGPSHGGSGAVPYTPAGGVAANAGGAGGM
jgi:hypothetical protein